VIVGDYIRQDYEWSELPRPEFKKEVEKEGLRGCVKPKTGEQ